MILKKFLGKTLEAVKKSALQMYGDDFIILDSGPTDGKNGAGITVMAGSGSNGAAGRRNNGPAGNSGDESAGRRNNGIDDSGSHGTGFGNSRSDGRDNNGSTGNKPASRQPEGNSKTGSGTAFRPRAIPPYDTPETPPRDKRGRFIKKNETRSPSGNRKKEASPYLEALRKYAEEQDAERSSSDTSGTERSRKGTRFAPRSKDQQSRDQQIVNGSAETYSRSSIRRPRNFQNGTGSDSVSDGAEGTSGARGTDSARGTGGADSTGGTGDTDSTRGTDDTDGTGYSSDEDKRRTNARNNLTGEVTPGGTVNSNNTDPDTDTDASHGSRQSLLNGHYTDSAVSLIRREQREVAALHKRFDKLEALLDSTLITSNFDYVSHPAFQQLVQTGISTSVIAGWFSSIIEQGVDPYDQPETFMAKLSDIIREAINCPAGDDPRKYMLFTGPSGAGKTQLIMKLTLHADFMAGKKVGVITLLPRGENSGHYYTIMEPFCKDWSIPWFQIKDGTEVTGLLEEWGDYDHLLIDTPSISTEQDHSFRQYWKLRQLVNPLAPLEVHYVVNASLNRYYFQQSLATHHPLQPDYIAITHLDEISQWGPVIPFLEEMGCAARYVSTGDSIPYSLKEFNPAWFAQQVLDDRN